MNIGIGRPAAVPDADMTLLGRWAAASEEAADGLADAYIHHHYGSDDFPAARADTLTSPEQIEVIA